MVVQVTPGEMAEVSVPVLAPQKGAGRGLLCKASSRLLGLLYLGEEGRVR